MAVLTGMLIGGVVVATRALVVAVVAVATGNA